MRQSPYHGGVRPVRWSTFSACALAVLAGCAAEKPRPPATRAPDAKTPALLSLMHTSARPTHDATGLVYGDLKDAKQCPHDPAVSEFAGGGALLLRFSAPVPTDLGMMLESGLGPVRVVKPHDLDDEDRLAASGRPYFYENDALSRSAVTGAVTPREVALWPGERRGTRSLQIALWDISFDPQATGADLQSAPMHVALVGSCPDFTLALGRDAIQLRPGEGRRLHAIITPTGDGVGLMALEMSVTGAPAGVKATANEPLLSSADWINKREATMDIAIGSDAPPAEAKIVLHARLGAIERTATIALTVRPKDNL